MDICANDCIGQDGKLWRVPAASSEEAHGSAA